MFGTIWKISELESRLRNIEMKNSETVMPFQTHEWHSNNENGDPWVYDVKEVDKKINLVREEFKSYINEEILPIITKMVELT